MDKDMHVFMMFNLYLNFIFCSNSFEIEKKQSKRNPENMVNFARIFWKVECHRIGAYIPANVPENG